MVGLGWMEIMILLVIASFGVGSVIATVLIVLALTRKKRE
jgi:hypothetical protein